MYLNVFKFEMNSDRVAKWRRRAQIAAAGLGMAYSYGKAKLGYNRFSSQSDMPPVPKKRLRVSSTSSGSSGSSGVRKRKSARMFPRTPKTNVRRRLFRRIGRSRSVAPKGVYRGKIKGLKKTPNVNRYATYGHEFKRESNTSYANSYCVYVGHGTDQRALFLSAIGGMFRALLVKAGIQVANWNDRWNPYVGGSLFGRILIWYQNTETSAETLIDISIAPTDTFDATLANIMNAMSGVSAAQKTNAVIYKRIAYYNSSNEFPSAVLDLQYFHITVEVFSKMKIQNRTLARKDVGEEGDDDSADNVEACPLTGKVYEQIEWKNGFIPKSKRSTAGGSSVLNTSANGIISANCDTLDVSGPSNMFRKPPPGYHLGEKIKAKTVKLDPGSIKDIKFKWKCHMLLNNYLYRVVSGSETSPANTFVQDIGKAQVFALEKELSIGSGDTTPVNVGVQVDQVFRCVGYSKKVKANPVVEITY